MQTAETILSIIQERGKRGSPLTQVYRMLVLTPRCTYMAYGKIYRNKGAMTKGTDGRDGGRYVPEQKSKQSLELLRYERY